MKLLLVKNFVLVMGVIFGLALPSVGHANEDTFYIGHNMTPTTEMLREGQWTAGTYAVAYGFSKKFFIATSPWIWASYNTANIHLKWIPFDDGTTRFGFFASYFESYNARPIDGGISGSSSVCRDRTNCRSGPGGGSPPPSALINFGLSRYQWKSTSLHALYSARWSPEVETYFSLKGTYYWNDDLPYSIRMDPGTDAIRGQFDATTLTEVSLTEDYHAGFEVGVLGANYLYPYAHMGASLSYLSPSWLVQLGFSYTIQYREMTDASGWTPGRFDDRQHVSLSNGEQYYFRYLQTAMHPEVQIQYYW